MMSFQSRLPEVNDLTPEDFFLIPEVLIPEALIPDILAPEVLKPDSPPAGLREAVIVTCPNFAAERLAFTVCCNYSAPGPFRSVQDSLPSISTAPFRNDSRVILDFEDWNKGYIFDWYRRYKLVQRNTAIQKLQLRKNRMGFQHEFVIIFIGNGDVYRIDRRPVSAVALNVIWVKGCEALDAIAQVDERALMNITSDMNLEIEVEFHGANKPGLHTVIITCVSIRMDPESARYTLQQFNCYFLARTIVIIMARHHLLQHSAMVRQNIRWDARLTRDLIYTQVFKENGARLDVVLRPPAEPEWFVDQWRPRHDVEKVVTNVVQEAAKKGRPI